MTHAENTYFEKTIARLYGMIEGLTIDCVLNEKEITELYKWMERHLTFVDVEPFKGLWTLLNDILEDQVIDSDEKEELLEWCSDVINKRGFIQHQTQMIRTLHGIFSGIVADKNITEDELESLQDWLMDYEEFKKWWPINEISDLLEIVLKDGKVDREEHKMFTAFFKDFSEIPLDKVVLHDDEYITENYMRSGSPFFRPISSICEADPVVDFSGNKFCFTGPAKTGKRKDLSSIVEKLGGEISNRVINGLDYLVIGAQSSPAWAYSTYGRKIETAMDKNKKSQNIKLVQEEDFIKAAVSVGGVEILPNPEKPPFVFTY